MTNFPALTSNSDAHRNANMLTVIGLKNTDDARQTGIDFIESLTTEELQETLAALAIQAASHCQRSFGGSKETAIRVMERMAMKLGELPNPE